MAPCCARSCEVLLATSSSHTGKSRVRSKMRFRSCSCGPDMKNRISPPTSSHLSAVSTSNIRFATRVQQTHPESIPQHVPTLDSLSSSSQPQSAHGSAAQKHPRSWRDHHHHFGLSTLFHRTFRDTFPKNHYLNLWSARNKVGNFLLHLRRRDIQYLLHAPRSDHTWDVRINSANPS